MSTFEIKDFYNRQIAALSPADQLLLASEILAHVMPPRPDAADAEHDAALAAQQRAAIKSWIGVFSGPPGDASVRHDEILYDGAES